jgi:hypothetical protein
MRIQRSFTAILTVFLLLSAGCAPNPDPEEDTPLYKAAVEYIKGDAEVLKYTQGVKGYGHYETLRWPEKNMYMIGVLVVGKTQGVKVNVYLNQDNYGEYVGYKRNVFAVCGDKAKNKYRAAKRRYR